MSCSRTLEEPELTPLRYLDPDTATPTAEEESAQDPWGARRSQEQKTSVQSVGSSTDSKKHCTQLSSEANAIVAAINGALAPQMGLLAGQMTSLKSDVVQLSAQVQHHDQKMSEFETQLQDVTPGRSAGSGAASSAASSEPHPDPARGNGSVYPPNKQRTVPVVGGFPYDTERGVCDL